MQNLNENAEKLLSALQGKRDTKEMEDYLMRQLSPMQTKELEHILNDPHATEQLLNTPEAQMLLKKLLGE